METKGREQGIGLIEVLVALAIIALVSGALIGVLSTSTKASAGNAERTTAESITQSKLEEIAQSSYDADVSHMSSTIPWSNDSSYIVQTLGESIDLSGNPSQADYGIQRVTIKVSHNGDLIMTTQTYKANHG
ncbi:MAG: prepilin-type N-terminal cleavage/methylation domain-containing protein [Dehalococcoidia bacterium]